MRFYMRFDIAGRLVDQGFDRQTPEAIIQTGKPFQTPGCAGCQNDVSACNRPCGDFIRRTSCHSLMRWILAMPSGYSARSKVRIFVFMKNVAARWSAFLPFSPLTHY
jgi:hypothetical protein